MTATAPISAEPRRATVTMKAAVYAAFGPPSVVHLADVPKPVPREGELLVRVRATTVSTADWRARSQTVPAGLGLMAGPVFGFTRPRHPILGTELAGDVEAVGARVTRFAPGDAVLAHPGAAFGCHAQYRCVPEDALVVAKPASLGYEAAAALCFGGLTALTFLRRGDVKAGEDVLVNGASGAVGSAVVQLAKHLGARVTAVCGEAHLDLVRSLGADEALDYARDDFTRQGRTWDVVVDTAGTAPFSRARAALRPRGRLLAVLGSAPDMLRSPWVAATSGQRIVAGPSSPTVADLLELVGLAEAKRFVPLVGATFPFERIADAHRLVDTGHKVGSVVVTL